MPAPTDTARATADQWLARLEKALVQRDELLLRSLFHPDCHWRDVLALSWRIQTVSGVNAVADALARAGHGTQSPRLQMPLTPARVWAALQAR